MRYWLLESRFGGTQLEYDNNLNAAVGIERYQGTVIIWWGKFRLMFWKGDTNDKLHNEETIPSS